MVDIPNNLDFRVQFELIPEGFDRRNLLQNLTNED